MNLLDRIFHNHTTLDEIPAQILRISPSDQYNIEVKPPRNGDVPATLNRFVSSIIELQSKWFKLRNVSPILAFEIRRSQPDNIRLQFVVPTRRLERTVRLQLSEEIPEIGLDQGTGGLPVAKRDTIGGGLLTLGRSDFYPLETEHQRAPINNVVALLHQHSLRNVNFVIQVLAQPLPGHPIKHRYWVRKAYKRLGYLRKDKPDVFPWHDRPATPREKKQADLIEEKASQPLWKTSIRILIINGDEYTKSHLKEISGGFRSLESPTTNQYLDLHTIRSLFPGRIIKFAEAVNRRRFDGWSLAFRLSPDELAALVTIPDQRRPKNIQEAPV